MSQGFPYDGWYNGNPELMIENGTYADFREHLEKRVELGKLKAARLKEYDDRWEKVPLEERVRRRSVVVDDSTPKEKEIQTPKGVVKVKRAKPSENNNAALDRKKGSKGPGKVKLPPGALTAENSPLLAKPDATAAK